MEFVGVWCQECVPLDNVQRGQDMEYLNLVTQGIKLKVCPHVMVERINLSRQQVDALLG